MKLTKLEFEDDIVLGNLTLDFTSNKLPSSVIYIAGENGTGKTRILDTIFNLHSLSPHSPIYAEKITYSFHLNDSEIQLLKKHSPIRNIPFDSLTNPFMISISNLKLANWERIKISCQSNDEHYELPPHLFSQPPLNQIFNIRYSDVAINFTPRKLDSVTSKNLDEIEISQKISDNIATEITQLLIDIQALDDSDVSSWARSHPEERINPEILDKRISRFQNAFTSIFPTKKYQEIRNENGTKKVIFNDHGKECDIESLSSGEKQIVFRGGFFLKDAGSIYGTIGVIDEPEISLHPVWQLKIMDYYRSIFSINDSSAPTQLFVATHSPFVLHSIRCPTEKIVVLSRDENNDVHVETEPAFFGWTPEKAISNAFQIEFSGKDNKPLIFVEGITDEKYIKAAVESLSFKLGNADINWIGQIDKSGNASFTGESALDKVLSFARANPSAFTRTIVLLYDCDTKQQEEDYGNLKVRKVNQITDNNIEKGIENLLALPVGFDITKFVNTRVKASGYGFNNTIIELDKVSLCTYLVDKHKEGEIPDLFKNFISLLNKLKSTLN